MDVYICNGGRGGAEGKSDGRGAYVYVCMYVWKGVWVYMCKGVWVDVWRGVWRGVWMYTYTMGTEGKLDDLGAYVCMYGGVYGRV